MNIFGLPQLRHLARRAAVCVRQSSPHQVFNHQKKSQQLQYALAEPASAFSWPQDDIQVLDAKVGITGKSFEGRAGCRQLAADVAPGSVGIVVACEAQRFAHNCRHWYQLLDPCGRVDYLIADCDGVHDASTINGRLLLESKRPIFELELPILRQCLTDGIPSKARRSEPCLDIARQMDPVAVTRSDDHMARVKPTGPIKRTVVTTSRIHAQGSLVDARRVAPARDHQRVEPHYRGDPQ